LFPGAFSIEPFEGSRWRSRQMKPEHVSKTLEVMAIAGLYDDSGKWLCHTGLPGKFGIAVISPPLDDAGNRARAQRDIANISNALGRKPYGAKPRWHRLIQCGSVIIRTQMNTDKNSILLGISPVAQTSDPA
jgi:hypothetical protein